MSSRPRRVGMERSYTGGPPLSQAGGKPIPRGPPNGVTPKEENIRSKNAEPATDDEPLSSSEEESESERLRRQEEGRKEEDRHFQENVAKEKAAKDTNKKVGKRKRDNGKKSPPSSSALSNDDWLMFGGIRSSQKLASSQSKKYSSQSNGFQMPKEVSVDGKFESTGNFITPKDVKCESPRKSQKTTNGSSANNFKEEKETTFRMPAPLKEDPSDNMSLPTSQFKEPPGQSTTSAPSSAFTTREFDFDDDFDDLSSLSSPPSELASLLSADDDEETKNIFTNTEQSLCPNCNAPVDPELLGEYLIRPNRRLKDDRLFCESHKMNKAEKDWTDNKYPTIDWDTFDKRVQGYLTELERLLVPNPSTFFRGRFESTLNDGQAKVFKFDLEGDSTEGLSCGYYGPKGANKMLNFVTSKYSGKLRQLAATDKVVKAAGAAAYAQAVLVPELTVLLIKEDMNVDSQDARQILRESTDIGLRLNPAEQDQIHVEEKNEDVNGNDYT
ncbi:hypothetical protein DPV78_006667 [Talaromyces pinophilus]|nr:hypothetical protein DPV78_006667 [Talaromyces pinophilus]